MNSVVRLVAVIAITSIAAPAETSDFAATGVNRKRGASELKAFYREGQSFLTRREDDSLSGEWYKVYTSARPIVSGDAAAKVVA
jgi:hypothetical protein